jgi:RNA polymerase sigma-70 factor (family 1)
MQGSPSEDDLRQKLKEGDESAYREIFTRYYPGLVSFAYKILSDHHHAKDVAQNIFIRIFSRRGTITITQNIKSYLYSAVHNECLNVLKKESVTSLQYRKYSEEPLDHDSIQDAIKQTERENKIYQAIENLPPQCRRIFVMSRLEEKKNKEIADVLGISIRTVETQISNALKYLRNALLSTLLWLF